MRLRELRTRLEGGRLRARRVFEGSAFTYDSEAKQDGLGSQVQRMLGTYVLSSYFRAAHVYSPIKRIGYTGILTPDVDGFGQQLVERSAHAFRLPSDESARMKLAERRVSGIPDAVKSVLSDGPALFRLASPHLHIDANPKVWAHLKRAISPPLRQRDGVLRVAIHVRRGDLHFIDSTRMLPNGYYISVARRLASLLDRLEIPFVFDLYSEAVETPVSLNQFKLYDREEFANSVLTSKHDNIDEFRVLSPINFVMGGDPLDTLLQVASADILITSRSSFSFLPGVIDQSKVVLFHKFWHNPMPHWVITKRDGRFSERAVTSQVRRLWRDRSGGAE